MVLLGWGKVFILINHRDLNFLLLQSSKTLMTSVHPVYTVQYCMSWPVVDVLCNCRYYEENTGS